MNTQYSTPTDRLAAIRAELDRLGHELAAIRARTEPAIWAEVTERVLTKCSFVDETSTIVDNRSTKTDFVDVRPDGKERTNAKFTR